MTKLRYNIPQSYLEVARASFTQIHLKVPVEADSRAPMTEDLANALFSVVSITIAYSFLALESFLNAQLFYLWERRTDGSPESTRFFASLGDESDFIRLKAHDKVRDVPARLKTLCHLLGYPAPYTAIPDTWRRLKELVATSRHFVVHPFPDTDFFNKNMRRIMFETSTGAYVKVVEEVLSFLYSGSGKAVPLWVKGNQLIQFRGVDILPVQRRDEMPPNRSVERDTPNSGLSGGLS